MNDVASLNPYFFVVGCPRSGTTLLRRMLDAHPRLAMMRRETHFIPRIYERRAGLTADGMVTPDIVDALLGDRHFVRLGIDREALEGLLRKDGATSYGRFVTGIFDLHGQSRGREFVGDKTPGYVRHLVLLNRLWPRSRFVQLIRDGRDVCLSVLEWSKSPRLLGRFSAWSDDAVATAALWWEWHVRAGSQDGHAVAPDRYCEVRYESLVSDPAGGCHALCEFLGVRFDESMIEFHRDRERDEPGRSAKRAWRPATAGLRD